MKRPRPSIRTWAEYEQSRKESKRREQVKKAKGA